MHGRLKDIQIADYYICSTKIMLTVYIYIHFSVNLEQKKARIVFEVDKEVTNQKVQISFCAIPPSPRQSPSLIVHFPHYPYPSSTIPLPHERFVTYTLRVDTA